MNDMDEIAYWVYTKRAPCLMNYDNPVKKQKEIGQTSKRYPSDNSVIEEVPSPKKKKRKLSLLDDDCVPVSKQQNVYFEASQSKQRTALSSCKSDTLEFDIDFNRKNTSIQDKSKKAKRQRNGRTLHKKNKIVTSTPLRRSLRKTHCVNNNEHLNVSYETYNCSAVNGNDIPTQTRFAPKKSPVKAPVAAKHLNSKQEGGLQVRAKNQTLNGQFEDLSDVSGFTANYIRSTKLHSNSKPHRNLRNTSTRHLVKESQNQKPSQENNTSMLVCMNKSVNTSAQVPHTSVLNCSTDSSQNVINLITTKNNEKAVKVDQSTSLLKFVEVKTPKVKDASSFGKVDSSKLTSKTDVIDVTLQTKSSRYPKRLKPQSSKDVTVNSSVITRKASSSKRKAKCGDAVEANSSYIKENTTESSLSRTRSRRNLALASKQVENAVLVFNNSTEQTSSLNTLNVANQAHNEPVRSKPRPKRVPHKLSRGAADKSVLPQLKDSLREKSGFSACFSDSDDDSDALKQRKFFC